MRVAVFDLDGTLADTSADLIAAANAAFAEAGLGAPLDPDRDQASPSPGAARCCARASPGAGARRTRRRSPASIGGCSRSMPTPSTGTPGSTTAPRRRWRALAAAGWVLAVCTNKPEALAASLLARLGLAGRFAAMLGADTLAFRKPDPRHVLGDDRARRRLARARGADRRHPHRPRRRPRRGHPLRARRLRPRGRGDRPPRRRRRCSRISTTCPSCSSGWCPGAPGLKPGRPPSPRGPRRVQLRLNIARSALAFGPRGR